MPNFVPCCALLFLAACQFPRPQAVDVTFDLGEKDVAIDATFSDLRLPDDRLHQLQSLGMLVSPDRAKAALNLPWVSKIDAWELTEKSGQASLRVKATATRKAFEACLALPCEGSGDHVCAMLPLNRKCQAKWYQELKKPEDDAYLPTPHSTPDWTPQTKRFVLSLTRAPHPKDQYRTTAAEAWPLFADRQKAVAALEALEGLDVAERVADAPRWDAHVATLSSLTGPLAKVATEGLRRQRLSLWYRLLRQFDSKWLLSPPSAHWLDRSNRDLPPGSGAPTDVVPPRDPPPPDAWQWKARAYYELRLREGTPWNEPDSALCKEPWIAKRADYQRFCAFTGGLAPSASSKPASPSKP